MKKYLSITTIAVTIILFITAMYLFLYEYESEDEMINLESFTGRIIPTDNLEIKNSTIMVSLLEALTWGEDAILAYGDSHGVEIWKPDMRTPGVFLYSSVPEELNKSDFKIINVDSKRIIFRRCMSVNDIILQLSLPMIFVILSGYSISYLKKH